MDSIALAVTGVLHAASLSIHAIGRGYAAAAGRRAKHGTKQIDLLLSNTGIELWRLFEAWVRFVVGARTEIVVAIDWTEFDSDEQATPCLYLFTRHVVEVVARDRLRLRDVHHEVDRLRFEAGLPLPMTVPVTSDARALASVRTHALSTYDRLKSPKGDDDDVDAVF